VRSRAPGKGGSRVFRHLAHGFYLDDVGAEITRYWATWTGQDFRQVEHAYASQGFELLFLRSVIRSVPGAQILEDGVRHASCDRREDTGPIGRKAIFLTSR